MNTVQPVAWMTEAQDGAPMLWPTRDEAAHYCAEDEQPVALYTQPTIDCRTCGHYQPSRGICNTCMPCHAGNEYKASGPVLLFMQLDN